MFQKMRDSDALQKTNMNKTIRDSDALHKPKHEVKIRDNDALRTKNNMIPKKIAIVMPFRLRQYRLWKTKIESQIWR